MEELTINMLCRVCLKNSNFYSNIYKDQSKDEFLVYELLNDVCVLDISVDDGLPEYVCGECFGRIVAFKYFKTQAQKGSSTLLLLRERMENPVTKQEELDVSGDESKEPFEEFNTEQVVKQETLDIPGDEYEQPFNELNFGPIRLKDEMLTVYGDRNRQELNESEESDIVSAVEPSAAYVEDSSQNDMEPLRLESDDEATDSIEEKIVESGKTGHLDTVESTATLPQDSLQEQFTHLETVTYLQHLDCLEHKRPHCRFNGAVIANACTMDISINDESIFEELSNISLGVEFEASLTGKAERLEGQGIHPGESMCMTPLIEGDVAVTKEESRGEVRKTGAEGGRGSVAEKVVEGERKSFKCYHCGNELMTKRGLIKHMELHGFGTSNERKTCGMIFQHKSKFITPGLKKISSKQFNCVESTKSVSQNSIHKRQIRSHMGYKPYKCEKCSKTFSFSSKLIIHMRTHTGSKPYKCLECSKCFSGRFTLVTHMRSHTGSKPYKCLECSRCFSQNSSLLRHMRSHTGSKPYKCLECSKYFNQRSNLVTHMRSHTGSKPYKCLECNKCFSRRFTLVTHMRSHTGSKPYKCLECSKCFSQKSHLVIHMRSHTGSKPYKCLECSRSFSNNSSLLTHMRSHTGIKPFICLKCSKSFSQNISLIKHMKLHAGSKQYPCMECNKWFSQTSHLTAHMKCHIGSFKCATCSKGFGNKFNLKMHLLVHTKEKCHECHNCRKQFSRRADLKRHIERHCKGIRMR